MSVANPQAAWPGVRTERKKLLYNPREAVPLALEAAISPSRGRQLEGEARPGRVMSKSTTSELFSRLK